MQRFHIAVLLIVLALVSASCMPTDTQQAVVDVTAPVEIDEDIVVEVEAPEEIGNFYDPPEDTIARVGLLLPLSGLHAELGTALLDAAALALFDIRGNQAELVVADTAGDEGAGMAAREVMTALPRFVVGPLFSADVTNAAPHLRSVPVLALSSDVTVAEPSIFVFGMAPEIQVERVVQYAVSQGYLRFAFLGPMSEFGKRMERSLVVATARHGGWVTARETYSPDGMDIESTIARLVSRPARNSDVQQLTNTLRERQDDAAQERLQFLASGPVAAFDMLFIPETGAAMRSIAAWLGYHDIGGSTVRLMGLTGWRDLDLLNEPVMQGAWFADTPRRQIDRFERRYARQFSRAPTRLDSLTYDAVALSLSLLPGNRSINDWRGFGGLEGSFRFNDDGTVDRGLMVLEVADGTVVVANQAPARFAPRDADTGS